MCLLQCRVPMKENIREYPRRVANISRNKPCTFSVLYRYPSKSGPKHKHTVKRQRVTSGPKHTISDTLVSQVLYFIYCAFLPTFRRHAVCPGQGTIYHQNPEINPCRRRRHRRHRRRDLGDSNSQTCSGLLAAPQSSAASRHHTPQTRSPSPPRSQKLFP